MIILFGSTGMLGNYVYKHLKDKYNLVCIRSDKFDIVKDEWETLENIIIHYLETSKDFIHETDDNVIINCAGIIPQNVNTTDYRSYIKVNSLFPHKLQEYARKYKCKFIHITTDCVYDGKKGDYTIHDTHTTHDIYGISKSIGEPSDSCIIRTSIIGEEIKNKRSLLEWVKKNKNGNIKGYTNHYWNGVTCLTIAKIIERTIGKNEYWKGVKHITSPCKYTKYDIVKMINEIFDLNIKIIKYDTLDLKDMTMISNYEFDIPNLREQIVELKNFNYL
jgi:dTDP-4-dehydrorhamnose reductase